MALSLGRPRSGGEGERAENVPQTRFQRWAVYVADSWGFHPRLGIKRAVGAETEQWLEWRLVWADPEAVERGNVQKTCLRRAFSAGPFMSRIPGVFTPGWVLNAPLALRRSSGLNGA